MTFDTLYREYYERLYRFACRMLGTAEEAKDTVQETFVKLHSALGSETRIKNPRTWLYTVTANLCRNQLKRKTHYRDVILKQLEPTTTQESVEADIVRKERLARMQKAIQSLEERDRTLIMLYQDRLPYAEMAEIIGVKPSSVAKLLSRSIEKLTKHVKVEARS